MFGRIPYMYRRPYWSLMKCQASELYTHRLTNNNYLKSEYHC